MTNQLEPFARQTLPQVEVEMREVLRVGDEGGNDIYGMMHYHMGWTDAQLNPVRTSAGKRVRPLLCLLTCDTAGGNWSQAVPAAAALELLHNFTLIHDDIQDASPMRRGRPTLWQLWGASQAINTGDAMFALSHLALLRLVQKDIAPATIIRAVRRFDETCVELTIGQNADMNFEERDGVTVDEYMAMIEGKTAALLSLSAELGALVAGCEPGIVAHYAAFGRELGLAFQVRDDILGIWGDETVIGKSAATDIASRKKSLPVLFGLDKSVALRQLYAQSEADPDFVNQAVQLLDAVGAREFAESRERLHSTNALDHLEAANPTGSAGQGLHELAQLLLNRQA